MFNLRTNLYVMRWRTGSQWSDWSTAVAWSHGRRSRTNRAAAWSTRCSGASAESDKPASAELQ